MSAATVFKTKLGLTSEEAELLLNEHGPNVLPSKPPVTLATRFVNQFKSPLIYILLFALVVDLVIWLATDRSSWPVESVAIAFILLLNAGLGVYQEEKAEMALDRLKGMSEARVWVLRNGRMVHLPSTQIVPGDIIRIEAGDRVPADGVLIETHGVMVDEALLTGESIPIDKTINDNTFSGTLLTRGKGYMKITRTGAQSTVGSLASMIAAIEIQETPLQQRLAIFGKQIARWVLAVSVGLVLLGTFIEGLARFGHVLMFAVALAVAAIPEGLPAVLTVTLALGVERMARKKAVVRRLSAVEALGSVTVIATDKTGTLTENRMQVKSLDTVDTALSLRTMVLANDAEHETSAGDPLEVALLEYASEQGLDVSALTNSHLRSSLLPFDSSYKFMRVTVEENDVLVSYLKGAPEVLLRRSLLSSEERKSWEEKAEAYAIEGFKVLALAWRKGEGDDSLTFLGLAVLWDPPRAEVPDAIRQTHSAGLRVVMVTGDHPATALRVADEIGISTGRVLTGLDLETLSPQELSHAVKETNVFARVSPKDKLLLVEALRANGEIVAVTGDGVNDAPALKRADVGIAMGIRGSDVSREVADLVLLDDNFATIVSAIEEGRNIYENIQKFVRFLFSANLALTILVLVGAVGSFVLGLREPTGGLLLPLTAMQLLWINVITNGPPALALGLDHNDGLMSSLPRVTQSPILDGSSFRFVILVGAASALIGGVLLVGLPRLGFSVEASRSLVFFYATISQLFMVYSARRIATIPRVNLALHAVVLCCVGFQVLTLLIPILRAILHISSFDAIGLIWVGAGIAVSCVVAEAYSRIAGPMPSRLT